MKKLFVHFGTHKTGTTSIQETLYADCPDEAFQYLSFGRSNSSAIVRRAYREKYRSLARDQDFRPISREQIIQNQKDSRERIIQSLKALPPNRNVIFSAEEISVLTLPELRWLAEDFEQFSNHKLIAIGYLRPPESYVNSLVQQNLKRKFTKLGDQKVSIRYKKRIGRFNVVFGRKNMKVKMFHPDALKNGDVVVDFCHEIGCATAPKTVERSNESLSLAAMQILYTYRTRFPTYSRIDDALIQCLLQKKGVKFRMSANLISKITNWSADDFDWLKKNHNIDFSRHWPPTGDGMNSEEDMLHIPKDTLDWISEKLQLNTPVTTLGDPETLATKIRESLEDQEKSAGV